MSIASPSSTDTSATLALSSPSGGAPAAPAPGVPGWPVLTDSSSGQAFHTPDGTPQLSIERLSGKRRARSDSVSMATKRSGSATKPPLMDLPTRGRPALQDQAQVVIRGEIAQTLQVRVKAQDEQLKRLAEQIQLV